MIFPDGINSGVIGTLLLLGLALGGWMAYKYDKRFKNGK
jgi:hypothetical protein